MWRSRIEETLMCLSYYGVTGKGVIVTVGVFVEVGVLLGVYVAVGVYEGVNVAVFVGVSVGGIRSVGVDVTVGVTEGVSVNVDVGVFVGVSVTVPVIISNVGLKKSVGEGCVAVFANVGLGVAVADESGARVIAITPTQ